MGRRRMRVNPNAVEQRAAEGRGRGTGRNYRPWLDVRTVPSCGLSSRIPGRTVGRVHHVFSRLEADCFYLLDFNPAVVDIREQFPLLPLDATRGIAVDRGYRHPAKPVTREDVVMTTDFVVTVRRPSGDVADVAIACKPAAHLLDNRTLEKLDIERLYWATRGVPWGVVTERELPRPTVDSVRWILSVGDPAGVVAPERIDRLTDHLRARIGDAPDTPLADVCAAEDDRCGLAPGSCLTLARHALATRRWAVDLADPRTAVRPDRPMPPLLARAPVLLPPTAMGGR